MLSKQLCAPAACVIIDLPLSFFNVASVMLLVKLTGAACCDVAEQITAVAKAYG